MQIELDESLLVGHDLIDQDHRDLVPLVNVFLASIAKDQGSHSTYDDVDEISTRFAAHFEREDELMAASNFPERQAHQAEHQALLKDLGKLLRFAEDGNDTVVATTTRTIEDWFLKHIAGSDKRLGQYLRTHS